MLTLHLEPNQPPEGAEAVILVISLFGGGRSLEIEARNEKFDQFSAIYTYSKP